MLTDFESEDSKFATARVLASADFSIEFDSEIYVEFTRANPYLGSL